MPMLPMLTVAITALAPSPRSVPPPRVASTHTALRCSSPSGNLAEPMVAGVTEERKIAMAEKFLLEGNGFYSPCQPDMFADDFVFRAPVVGPLCKSDYIATMSLFELWNALPDMKERSSFYGWCVDPSSPSTVRVFVKNTGTHTGPLNVGSVTLPPSGKPFEGTTESIAITLDDQGEKVRCLTAGYVVDRFAGNGGGLGAVAGILVAIGLPVPKPYGRVFRFSQWLGNTFGTKFGPRTISKEEDIPAWWRSPLRGTEGL
jgi:hypothetical protein